MEYKSEQDIEVAMSLRRNAWHFSGAKNIAMNFELAEKIKDEKGVTRTWEQFKKEALKLNAEYNQRYLQAEYQTVLASSQAALKWQDIQRRKERYPNLEYKTVGDSQVRDEHAVLNGIIRPVDHVFWATYYPPNGWRCRCYVNQTDRPANGDTVPEVNEKTVPMMFRENLAITKPKVLSDKHPYFEKMRKDIKRVNEENKDKGNNLKYLNTSLPDKLIKIIPYEEVNSYSNGGKVYVHAYSDKNDFVANYKNAKMYAKNNGANIHIRYHLQNDSNPEYIINGLTSDRVAPKKDSNFENALNNAFKSKKKQIKDDNRGIALDLSNRNLDDDDILLIARRIHSRKDNFSIVGITYRNKSLIMSNYKNKSFDEIYNEVKKIRS